MVKVALDTTNSTASPDPGVKSVPAPRQSRWVLKLLLLGIVLVAAAPSLISVSGQAPSILMRFNSKLGKAVTFQRLKMHWWAPVEITGLKIRDLSDIHKDLSISDAPLLCEIERAVTMEPLWRIAMNAGRGTGVALKSPQLNLIADERGTNIDRTVTAIFGVSNDSSDSVRFPFRVTIEDGAVVLRSNIAPNLVDPALTTPPISNQIETTVPTVVSSEIAASVSSINGSFSTMDTERWLPEMKLTAAIQRVASDALAGQTQNPKNSPKRNPRLAAGLDEVVNDFPDVPLEDLAGLDESGDSTGARIQVNLKPRADEKGRQTIQVGARDVDLRLLQPFLSMLGLEASCSGVVSGGIDARLAGANVSDGLVGRMMLQGIGVRVRQQTWAADEWLTLGNVDATGALAVAEDGILVQDLNIHSDVAQLTGSGELRYASGAGTDSTTGNSRQVEIKGSVDVARLSSSLRKTLAIHDDVSIEKGRITFGLRGSTSHTDDVGSILTPGNSSPANVAAAVYSLAVAVPISLTTSFSQKAKWQLVIKTEELAAIRAGQPLVVDSTMRLDAVGPFIHGLPELARARLTADFGTIDCAPDKAAWKISGTVQPGALWQQLRQFADIPEPGLRGDVSFQSRVALHGETIQLTDLQLNSSDVKASSMAIEITPSNPLTSMLDGTVHLEGSGAALRTLLSPWHDASWLSERANVVSDLTATPTREIQLAVRVSPENMANVQRSNVLSVSSTHGHAVVPSRAVTAPSTFLVDEADVNLSLLAKNSGQQFDIQKGTLKLPGLSALVSGVVSVRENELQLEVIADTTYDLDILSRRLLTADSALRFSGQGRDQFQITGSPSALSGVSQGATNSNSVSASQFKGAGTVKWASAEIWGLQIGEASVQASLENSLLRTAPIQCLVNGGQLNMMPQYDIASSRLQLGTGSRIQNLKITPELCRTWLGYVAPMLADSADVKGEVSARVERFLWDFDTPGNSDVLAQLTIHQAEAAPGSSLSSLLEVVDLLRRTGDSSQSLTARSLVLPEQTIPVQVRQGFVAHEGLIMELSDYRMKTSGAVGLNKELQMVIEVPLEKSTAAGSGRSLKVPLRGTMTQPQPDTGALLQNLGTQKIQEKLGDQVDKTLNKQLNKLFDKF